MEALLKGLPLDYLAKCDFAKTGQSWQAFLPAGSLVKAAERLLAADWHLEDLAALDCVEGFVVTYHFAHFEMPGRVSLRVLAPHDNPVVPSIALVFHGAEWHERETRDFHGVEFAGNPNPVPLLLDPDMADCFPLRKDPKSRVKMREMLEAGEVVFANPSFTYMTPDAPAEAQEAGGGAATA
jgi:NADH-quinone oxidoreductase subunit C